MVSIFGVNFCVNFWEYYSRKSIVADSKLSKNPNGSKKSQVSLTDEKCFKYNPKINEGPHCIEKSHNGEDWRLRKPPEFANDLKKIHYMVHFGPVVEGSSYRKLGF